MTLDRKFLVSALCYAIAGMSLGVFMAATHDHGQFITHAHVMLVGFVVSLIYGVIHKLWLQDGRAPRLARLQLALHQAGAVVMTAGLFVLYGGYAPQAVMDPILAVASIVVLIGAVLMLVLVTRRSA
jgi:hypothetical protein